MPETKIPETTYVPNNFVYNYVPYCIYVLKYQKLKRQDIKDQKLKSQKVKRHIISTKHQKLKKPVTKTPETSRSTSKAAGVISNVKRLSETLAKHIVLFFTLALPHLMQDDSFGKNSRTPWYCTQFPNRVG
jgi:hypothetical protein